jgi:hypothetical protein
MMRFAICDLRSNGQAQLCRSWERRRLAGDSLYQDRRRVAQIFNLLYRRILFCNRAKFSHDLKVLLAPETRALPASRQHDQNRHK